MFEKKPALEQLKKSYSEVRKQTREILAPLEIEDYVIQTDFFMSPPRWHLGHVSWFFDQLLREHSKKYSPFSHDFGNYLNSYYRAFGEPFDKGRRGTVSRPTVAETIAYADWIDEQIRSYLDREQDRFSPDIFRLFMMGINHEYQHQELLIYDVQHLLQERYRPKTINQLHENPAVKRSGEMIRVPGGLFELGYVDDWDQPFYYDIEAPLHKVYLNDFMIDRYPVTNGAYLEFIEAGGYQNFRYWLSDGWDAVQKDGWRAPLYWEQDESGAWHLTDFRGRVPVKDYADEPVVHVSYYEAWAYARWAGKRLPTEAEWEKTAAWDEDTGSKRVFPWGDDLPGEKQTNLFEDRFWMPLPAGALPCGKSFYGAEQMVGDMWEWTATEFMPYPGFRSGFAEYNDKWFGNQKVLRGGSFATSKYQTRNTYRNFFRCPERWLISGFRCAQDC